MAVRVDINTVAVNGQRMHTRRLSQAIGADVTATVQRGVTKITPAVEATLKAIYATLKRKHGRAWSAGGTLFGNTGQTLRVRSGAGLKSIERSIRVKRDMKGGVIGHIDAGDMAIHETGGSVRATNRRYLAIPTVYAMNSRGITLSTPRGYSRERTFVRKTRRGKLFVFERQRGGRIIPLFLLKKVVRIPKRLGLYDAVRASSAKFESAVARILREAGVR